MKRQKQNYKDHVGLVYKVLGQRGVEEGEGIMPFIKTMKNFNPKKGAFSTFFYHNLVLEKFRLDRFKAKRISADETIEIDEAFWVEGSPRPDSIVEFRDGLNHLSKDAKAIIKFILTEAENKSERVLWPEPSTLSRCHIRAEIRTHFREECNWAWDRYWLAVKEIENFLKK